MYREAKLRLRVVSLKDELQFLLCVKNNLWGAKNSHLKNWSVGDFIVFVINKEISALAKVNGEPYKSDEKIWTNGSFPYKLPISFEVILSPKNRIAVTDEVKDLIKDNWDNYGIPMRFKLLLPDKSAKGLLNLILSKQNSLIYYLDKIETIIKEFEIHTNNNTISFSEIDNLYIDPSEDKEPAFKRLKINDWRQFKKVDIKFHDNLTILTGANGTGKTTLLNLLNYHLGWEPEFINSIDENLYLEIPKNNKKQVGKLSYNDGKLASIFFSNTSTYTYKLQFENIQKLNGLYIPSHRPVYGFNQVESIPTRIKPLEKIYHEYTDLIKRNYSNTNSEIKPNYVLKESLISLAMFGYGNDVIEKNLASLKLFEEFKEILKLVLPPSLGFNDISIILPNVIFETDTGSFPIDAVSGGIAAIIDMAWQIFLQYKLRGQMVVTIDEPENHLHPEMQKRIMPSLIKAFPNVQFIVITHNPFIISSVKNSSIYILKYDQNKVITEKLDFINKAGTSNDILREALGLEMTMPLWVEDKLEKIIKNYSNEEITEENFQELRNEMKNIGLERYIPTTVVNILKQVKNND
jgi:predicted ATPase